MGVKSKTVKPVNASQRGRVLRFLLLVLSVAVAVVAAAVIHPALREALFTSPPSAGVVTTHHNAAGQTWRPLIHSPGGVFVCGSKLKVSEGSGAMALLVLERLGGPSIGVERVNDGYCDCADGSDEPWSAACASVHAATTFTCVGDVETTIPLSRVDDGVVDCCDASDETRGGTSRPTGESSCASLRLARRQLWQRRLLQAQSGHVHYQQRARHGSAVFGPQFIANVTNETAQLEASYSQFKIVLDSVQARMRQRARAGRATNPFSAAAAPDAYQDAKEDEEAAGAVDPAEIAHVQKWSQYFSQKRGELGAKQLVLQTQGLGPYYEYFPLFGRCFNATVTQKALKGGSAEPEQYDSLFHVCPFMYILQRTQTPDVLAAAERVQLFEAARQAKQSGVASETDVSDEAAAAAAAQQDSQTSRFLVAGYWAGLTNNTLDNITALDVQGRLLSERLGHPILVSQYLNGEKCGWDGPPRVSVLIFTCDTTDRVLRIVENGNCRYEIDFGTPSACTDEWVRLLKHEVSRHL